MEQAIKYFTENIVTVNQTIIKFNLNRKELVEELKKRHIDTSKFSTEKFIKISNSIHNYKYDYSLVGNFKKVTDKVRILCPFHGEFKQDVYNHKKGKGCPKCGDVKTANSKYDTTESFIAKAKNIHKNLYDYSLIDYKSTNEKVEIICKEHGIYKQAPNKHLQGQGCTICHYEKKGWSKATWKKLMKKDSLATFYIIRCFNDTENFIKIGRTINTVQKRYASKKEIPYSYEILQEIKNTNSDLIFDLEVQYKRLFKNYRYTPKINFGGRTECFDISIKDKIISVNLTN